MANPALTAVRDFFGFAAPDESNVVSIAPIRQASPEDDGAAPATDIVISRSGDASWLSSAWMNAIATNDDPILARDGSGLKLYDALLSDDTAFSTLQQRRLAITSREYEVIPGDDSDPHAIKAADDLRAMIDALGFDRVTGLLHYGVWYGYAVGEAIYTTKVHDGRTLVWLDDIVVPDRRWFGFTAQGELRQVGVLNATGDGGVVPPNKFLTIRTGGTHDFAFYGLGLAHWCYWPIFFKRAALKFWALYLEKRGNPTVAIEFTQAEKDDLKAQRGLLQAAVAVGKDSAVLVPEGTLEKRLKILESQRSGGTGDFRDFLTEQNEAIMRVVLGQPGTSKGVSSGLNSDQASEHADVKGELVKADSDLITDAIRTTFAKWITRWNHGPDVAVPIIRRILDDSEDLTAIANRDATLDGIGIKRTEDSVKATFGDGYVLERETPEQRVAREATTARMNGLMPVAGNDNGDAEQAAAFQAKGEGWLAFTAADDAAIKSLVDKLTAEGDPVFEVMAKQLEGALEGVDNVEAARVAILDAVERLPIDRLARLTALPLLAERAGASIGASEDVTG